MRANLRQSRHSAQCHDALPHTPRAKAHTAVAFAIGGPVYFMRLVTMSISKSGFPTTTPMATLWRCIQEQWKGDESEMWLGKR